jgi:excinuclease ABC subunit A
VGLVGACYVLDEPTIGLHQRDNDRLIATLRHLADIGNTVLVVEHDEDMIRQRGPRAGHRAGPGRARRARSWRRARRGDLRDPRSITGDYLSGRGDRDVPAKRRTLSEKNAIVIKGASENNLKGSMRRSRWAGSSASRACRARASRRW